MTTILKVGGSVITEKTEPETLDRAALETCCREIGAADEDLVLIHGAGSFGHYHAEQYDVTVTEGTHDAGEVLDIHDSMRQLNDSVVSSLQAAGAPAIPVPPLAHAHRDAGGNLSEYSAHVAAMIEEGFVPVLFGDVIVQESEGFTVISGDEIAVHLAQALGATRVGMCSNVPGVYDEDGSVRRRITSLADAPSGIGGSEGHDVTGGMAEKLRELLRLPMPAAIFGLEDLGAFLAGEQVGTVVDTSGD